MILDFYDKEFRPWVNARLTNSAMIGHTTATTVRLWFRVWKPGKYWLAVLAEDAGISASGTPAVSADGKMTVDGEVVETISLMQKSFSYSDDLTQVFYVRGLNTKTRFRYVLFADSKDDPDRKIAWEIGHDIEHFFQTDDDERDEVCFGLYSCHMPYTKNGNVINMQLWKSFKVELEKRAANFVLGGGDQVYTDGQEDVSIWKWLRKVKKHLPTSEKERIRIMLSWYRDIYRGYWGFPELLAVYRRFPQYMIWDDHEIMDGWGSYKNKELSNKLDTMWEWENVGKNLKLARQMFKAATKVYEEYQHSHNPPTDPGVFDYQFDKGDSAFYALDMRGHRDNNGPGGARILGREQMDRVLTWLKSPKVRAAKTIFIVSSVPVVHVTDFVANTFDLSLLGLADDLRDEWEHNSNWEERDKLLDALFKYSHSSGVKVIFLSGDVHIGAAFKLYRKNTPNASIYQVTSSAITYASAPGRLLQLATKERGQLGGSKNATVTYFSRLVVFNRNNYAIVRCGGSKVNVEFFGANENPEEIVKHDELEF